MHEVAAQCRESSTVAFALTNLREFTLWKVRDRLLQWKSRNERHGRFFSGYFERMCVINRVAMQAKIADLGRSSSSRNILDAVILSRLLIARKVGTSIHNEHTAAIQLNR